jgi:hypothetical protein
METDTHTNGLRGALERPRYFARQLVTPAELNLEGAYLVERIRQHNRLLHGWGVICGARVCRIPTGNGSWQPWQVGIRPGSLIDGNGNHVTIACDRVVDVRRGSLIVGAEDPPGEVRDAWCCDDWADETPPRVYIAVCHRETPSRPVPTQPAGCGCDDTACEFSRWQDGYEVKILDRCPSSHAGPPPTTDQILASLQGPLRDCPELPDDPCVVLAAVDVDVDGTITAIDNCSCRRNVASLADVWWRCGGDTLAIHDVTMRTERPIRPGTKGIRIEVSGRDLTRDTAVAFGPGITITRKTVSADGTLLRLTATVAEDARPGDRSLTLTNPDSTAAIRPRVITVEADR